MMGLRDGVQGPPVPFPARRGLSTWRSLVSPWYNALLTAACLVLAGVGGKVAALWAWRWARWDVVAANLRLFAVGSYPPEAIWRVWAALGLVAALAVATAFLWRRPRLRRILGVLWACSPAAVAALLSGVRTTLWGGLLVTLTLAAGGILLSFPLGVLLALGRRSRLPAIRLVCAAYIEVVRGVPLVTILFMAQVLTPLVLPGMRLDKLLRALAGITAFSSAYMAENVRGGLQGVPLGQFEAAHALGLSPAQTMVLVVLPQALRKVVPAIAGQFISLFKDTSLVAVMGILDLLGIARNVVANPLWLGRQAEVYIFAGAVYWAFTYGMSSFSRRLEGSHGRGST